LGKFRRDLKWKLYSHLVYFTAIWFILWPFGLFYGHLFILWSFGIFVGHLVYFVAIWYIWYKISRFGIFKHKKFGNRGYFVTLGSML
jgi:hypothetical protein